MGTVEIEADSRAILVLGTTRFVLGYTLLALMLVLASWLRLDSIFTLYTIDIETSEFDVLSRSPPYPRPEKFRTNKKRKKGRPENQLLFTPPPLPPTPPPLLWYRLPPLTRLLNSDWTACPTKQRGSWLVSC